MWPRARPDRWRDTKVDSKDSQFTHFNITYWFYRSLFTHTHSVSQGFLSLFSEFLSLSVRQCRCRRHFTNRFQFLFMEFVIVIICDRICHLYLKMFVSMMLIVREIWVTGHRFLFLCPFFRIFSEENHTDFYWVRGCALCQKWKE